MIYKKNDVYARACVCKCMCIYIPERYIYSLWYKQFKNKLESWMMLLLNWID